jgi:hypothetical protein
LTVYHLVLPIDLAETGGEERREERAIGRLVDAGDLVLALVVGP